VSERRKFNRAVALKLECGCIVEEDCSRYRVSKDLASIIYGNCLRHGMFCSKHRGLCQPIEFIGVVRSGSTQEGGE
jgi:hypothetical protein